MKKKAIYMTPATQVLEMEANENILAGSGLSNSDRNDISFSDETFDEPSIATKTSGISKKPVFV